MTATAARWWIWLLLFVLPSVAFVLLAISRGAVWLIGVPVSFLVTGGPGSHLFRRLTRADRRRASERCDDTPKP